MTRITLLTALCGTALGLAACADSHVLQQTSLPHAPPAFRATSPTARPVPTPYAPFLRTILPTHHPDLPQLSEEPINAERVTAPTPILDTQAPSPPDPPSALAPVPLTDILFDYDSALIRPDAADILHDNLTWLEAHPLATVIIEGHCDERGSAEYNLAIGQQRADAVRSYLITAGIAPGRLTTISYGKDLPFALDHSESAWQLNRRAHLRLTSPEE